MKLKALLIGAVAAAMLLGSGIGQASESNTCSSTTHNCVASDTNTCVTEPILTRSDAARIDTCTASLATNHLDNANLKSHTISATGGKITAAVTVQGALVHDISTVPNILPYSGQHVLALFQTHEFEIDHVIGQDATGADVHWGPPGYNADKYRWFLYYGWNSSELRDLCGLGYYDPTGELVPPVPVFFGQTFFVIGQPSATNVQQPTATCTLSNGDKTVTMQIPYTYKYSDRTGLLIRSLPVVTSGESVQNASTFTWLDHEIGGPDPVGLILGWTWYTDAIPFASYKLGLIAGDPNPAVFAGPKCLTNPDGDPVTGPGGPCTIDNPVGTGFVNTGKNFSAA